MHREEIKIEKNEGQKEKREQMSDRKGRREGRGADLSFNWDNYTTELIKY